jgi:Flp pilus assembly protein TadB
MERAWLIVSCLGLLVAVVFLWLDNINVVFVAGVLGAVAWFMSYKERLQKKMTALGEEVTHDEEKAEDQDED